MFQDIEPHRISCEFKPMQPTDAGYVVVYNHDSVLLKQEVNGFTLPTCADLKRIQPGMLNDLQYLLSVDDNAFFLSLQKPSLQPGFVFKSPQIFRKLSPTWLAFAGATAAHLGRWYEQRRFCGRCGATLSHKPDERALVCRECGLTEYPKISPVVIVGIINNDKLLLTKAAAGVYRRYALVAGYVEIGETLEAAVRREVMEETGLRIKNIRYYKSQPWPFSSSVLAGFFADLDGPDTVTLDTRELAEAVWLKPTEIPEGEPNFSLTGEMIEAFRRGLIT